MHYERDDEWASEIQGRLQSISDLHAADALYHQACSVNFRTNKKIPLAFSSAPKKKENSSRGRPAAYEEYFLNIVEYLKNHDDEQITIKELVDKMNDSCGEQAYSSVYLKRKLKNHFKDDILIRDISGKSSIVTLRDNATTILQNFYHRPKHQNSEDEKQAIILAAAKLIKSDIRSVETSKEYYPFPSDIASIDRNLQYVQDSLRLLMKTIFVEKDINWTGSYAILGLGIQLHHNFASRFLVSTIHSLGFCTSYSEIQRFESSAAISQGIDLPGDVSNSFIQFVADNVDHNIRTLDGNDTFHGMGLIAGITSGTMKTDAILRRDVSAEDIKAAAKINIQYYKPQNDFMAKMTYSELEKIKTIDKTVRLDLLSLVVWPLKNPTPGWSGTMQMVHKGEYPGKSTVSFLPMIDMSVTDMSCIYSTLTFVCNLATRYDISPVLTFDQPLYWRALTIVQNEQPNSQLKSLVLRLGGFHTEMSFMGSIGHIMSNSGIQEILELIYAPNAVSHIHSTAKL
ncbi:unnamed protein product [Mytilus coruscus]|uniref:Uncharacterized protein n=1 Tax=Mytilus coruscus TaxID=42192 RepID=A0A6J8BEG9_MYTCO|nr:unnamed protein product [Mytilus coruscus]